MFWPTGRCPFRCLHCDLPILGQKRQELTLDEIVTVFERSRVLTEQAISIAGGEPFIRRDMVDILDFLTSRGNPVFVTSNGWYLERMAELSRLARPDRLTVGLSIDGLGDTHDAIRRQGSFERVTRAIEIVRSAGCAVQVNTVVQPENVETLPEIAEFFQQQGVSQVFIPLASFPGIEGDHLAPKDYTGDRVAEVARWVNSQPTDAKYVLSEGEYLIQDCHAGSSSCYIDPEGDVYACMTYKEWSNRTDYRLGSLREAGLDFDALWTSERAEEVRRAVKACAGCYTGCEVSRETKRHGWAGTLDPIVLSERLRAPSELRLDAPTSTPYLIGEWYWREIGFRWMGARAGVRLTRPAAATGLRISCETHHPDLGERPVAATILVDGVPAGRHVFSAQDHGRCLALDFPLAARPADGLAEVEILVDRVWVPHEFRDSPDRRRLGLVVRSVAFRV